VSLVARPRQQPERFLMTDMGCAGRLESGEAAARECLQRGQKLTSFKAGATSAKSQNLPSILFSAVTTGVGFSVTALLLTEGNDGGTPCQQRE